MQKTPLISIKLQIQSAPLLQANTVQYLGVYIDDQLNWKPHVKHSPNKLTQSRAIL